LGAGQTARVVVLADPVDILEEENLDTDLNQTGETDDGDDG
jgi:hypothetical protein